MLTIPRKLDIHVAWTSKDVRDPSQWTLELTPEDHDELDTALAHAKAKSSDLLQIDRGDFPLKGLATKLAQVERDLIDGRGFTRISALNTERYDDDDLTMLYWGIGMHLGDPWPQNKHGHVMGDVTDQNKRLDDPTIRGNEIGLIALDYHTDGSDLVGLMCLRAAKSGGLSCVANIVAIYNKMVDDRPDLVAALFEDMPWDYRGEEPAGGKPYYMRNVFTEHDGRLFCRFVPQYIRSSQRHADAPRLSERSLEALEMVTSLANQPDYNVYMDLRPGEMQFINNYHVLHGRTSYEDDIPNRVKRHLKRLWLATRYLQNRPHGYDRSVQSHWNEKRSVSRLHAESSS